MRGDGGALHAEDPAAQAVPYCLSGGTDAKSFSRLGIRCFGFAPLQLPADLDFSGMFHGIDERVPVDALPFGSASWTDFSIFASPSAGVTGPSGLRVIRCLRTYSSAMVTQCPVPDFVLACLCTSTESKGTLLSAKS